MTQAASPIGPTTSCQAAFKEPSPAAAAGAPAVASDDTGFPNMFRSLRDDEDMHNQGGDSTVPAEVSAALAPAEGESQFADALIGVVVPIMFNLPGLAMAPVPANSDVFAGKTAGGDIGTIATVQATGNGASAATLPHDVQSSLAGAVLQPDAELALTPKVLRSGPATIKPAMGAVPFVQAAFQAPAALTADTVKVQAQQSSMPAASRPASPASASETESAVDVFHVGSPNGSAEFASVSLHAATNTDGLQAATLKLPGAPSQWQQPLREALGEHLQVQVGRQSEHAVIRLDPPMLGRIEISIRHEAGALQVHMSASNGEVLRQLQGIGDSLRQDLIHRQYNDVAVVVSSSFRQGDADGTGRQRQGNPDREEKGPGRALHDADQGASTYAFLKDSE
jgi:flagellar hook-length control protein FliK